MDASNKAGSGRRGFMGAAAAAAAAPVAWHGLGGAGEAMAQPATPDTAMQVTLTVNGHKHPVMLDPRTTLLDALRERVGLAGTKKGCDHGQCGACTVHMDGERVLACLTLAAQAEGSQVTTIEGLAEEDALHPMQQAFIDHDAFQCGYCTPGQIMSAVACVREGHASGAEAIREYMSGNLCRCAAYPNIVAAIEQVAATKKG